MAASKPPEKLRAEWFWGDRWMRSSAFLLPLEARGLYREMLTQAWLRGGSLPSDPATIRRACGVTEDEWARCWPLVQGFWADDGDGAIFNATQREVMAEGQRRLADARELAVRGGKKRAESAKRGSDGRFASSPLDQPAGKHLDQPAGQNSPATVQPEVQPLASPPSPSPSLDPDQSPDRVKSAGQAQADLTWFQSTWSKICERVGMKPTRVASAKGPLRNKVRAVVKTHGREAIGGAMRCAAQDPHWRGGNGWVGNVESFCRAKNLGRFLDEAAAGGAESTEDRYRRILANGGENGTP